MRRVLVLSDPDARHGRARGAGVRPDRRRDRPGRALRLPVEWVPVSSGARIAMDSGTENLDATARVVRRIVTFTQAGGVIHLIVAGVNVGAQSYWDALATMLMHTRGALIMTPDASMVLTGRAALAASGSVSAEDEVDDRRLRAHDGPERRGAVLRHRSAERLPDPLRATTATPTWCRARRAPRKLETHRPERARRARVRATRSARRAAASFSRVGEIFDDETNPGRKRPFAMRAVMRAVIDRDGGHLERWGSHVGAETAIVWDAHLGGHPVCLIGIESQNVPRVGYRPSDGPEEWNGGTLFPQSSKKVARALNAASGNRPVVILANLSGFDGSPESMRKLQLEYGAEIARAVVNFDGPILFLVVSRYHGGAYVVFSRELNDEPARARGRGLVRVGDRRRSGRGGGVRARGARARRGRSAHRGAARASCRTARAPRSARRSTALRRDVTIEKRAEVAAEFDSIHTVERAKRVGSLEEIIPAREIRPLLIELLDEYRG